MRSRGNVYYIFDIFLILSKHVNIIFISCQKD